MPQIDDTLHTLAGLEWSLIFDLLSGNIPVEVAGKDRPKTELSITERLFEFKVMPFSLCNVQGKFQRLMDFTLAGLHWSHFLVYIDDVIIKGKTFNEHLLYLQDESDHFFRKA